MPHGNAQGSICALEFLIHAMKGQVRKAIAVWSNAVLVNLQSYKQQLDPVI
jgi:hypothetical protein